MRYMILFIFILFLSVCPHIYSEEKELSKNNLAVIYLDLYRQIPRNMLSNIFYGHEKYSFLYVSDLEYLFSSSVINDFGNKIKVNHGDQRSVKDYSLLLCRYKKYIGLFFQYVHTNEELLSLYALAYLIDHKSLNIIHSFDKEERIYTGSSIKPSDKHPIVDFEQFYNGICSLIWMDHLPEIKKIFHNNEIYKNYDFIYFFRHSEINYTYFISNDKKIPDEINMYIINEGRNEHFKSVE